MARGHRAFILLAALSFGGVGCGSSDDDDDSGATNGVSAATLASFEGTYALTGFTENQTGCDAEGSPVTQTESTFVMVGASALGTSYLELVSCSDAASCADKVDRVRHPKAILASYVLIFSSESGPDHLAGLSATNGYDAGDGQCVAREYDDHQLARTGDRVRIETRYTPLPAAPSQQGSCPVHPSELQAEAKGVPCGKLRVIEGTKTGPLPG